jgi:hypothetical protein
MISRLKPCGVFVSRGQCASTRENVCKFHNGVMVRWGQSRWMFSKEKDSDTQYDSAEWEPAFQRQAREFLFFPLLPREASTVWA